MNEHIKAENVEPVARDGSRQENVLKIVHFAGASIGIETIDWQARSVANSSVASLRT